MNFENSTDIIFVHKMNEEMEQQVIGRAQRLGRKDILNIIYLQYENESEYVVNNIGKSISFVNTNDINNELEDFYNEKQYYNVMQHIDELELTVDINIPDFSNEIIDINLESLISSL